MSLIGEDLAFGRGTVKRRPLPDLRPKAQENPVRPDAWRYESHYMSVLNWIFFKDGLPHAAVALPDRNDR
jgi:hypothetical protein